MYQKQRTTKSYSITSPYMQLLESKKKVYGMKYHSSVGGNGSHPKYIHNQNMSNLNSSSVKGRPVSSSLASHHNKSAMKSNSSQKVKSTKTQNVKKKRIYTQQAQKFNYMSSDPKMHQSLFVNMDKNQHNQLAGKQLFLNDNDIPQKNNYINNYDFLKKFSEFNAQLKQKQNMNCSESKSQKSSKSTKSRGKTGSKKTHNNHSGSINFQSINIGKSIQQLGLTQIDDFICLIDNCVQEANQYISFLALKVQSVKNQLIKCKGQQLQLQLIIKQKNQQLQVKDHVICKLRKQIQLFKTQRQSEHISTSNMNEQNKSKQMKKILQVLNEMNEQNHFLESKVKRLEEELGRQSKPEFKQYASNDKYYQEGQWVNQASLNKNPKQRRKSSNSKEVYNQIHSKIDILNISIDNNKHNTNYSSYCNEQDPKGQSMKYNFIKPRNK